MPLTRQLTLMLRYQESSRYVRLNLILQLFTKEHTLVPIRPSTSPSPTYGYQRFPPEALRKPHLLLCLFIYMYWYFYLKFTLVDFSSLLT